MYFTLTSTLSSPTTTSLTPPLSSSNSISIFNFPSSASNRRRHGRPHTIRFSIKSSHNSLTPLQLQPISAAAFEKQQENTLSCSENHENSSPRSVAKPIVFTLFCIVVGLFPIFRGFRLPVAIAAAAATQATKTKKMEGKNIVLKQKGHEYSNLTRVLLRTVSELVRSIEKVRSGKGNLESVEAALREVKSKKKELVKKIMKELYPELRELRRTRPKLIKKAEKIREWVLQAEKEGKLLSRRAGLLNREKAAGRRAKLEERMVKMEERIPRAEDEYNAVLEKLDEIEDRVSRREHMALSVGVRELAFIERECELLVEKFRRDMRRQGNGSVPSPLTKLSRSDIQKELQSATRQFWEQKILPSVLEAEDIGYPFHEDSVEFAQRIKHVLKYSRDLQSNLEVGIKKIMKRFGVEKRFVVNTPVDEVVKGFPEVESKRTFGSKEIVVPKAVGLHLFHGWKKWREEAKAELKRNLLENADFGKKYVAEKQERILLDRDRVASKTWYNEERNRWEMDPISVPYAVSRKLVENARIRHDWAVMYLALKGDNKEYFVDIKEFEVLFEDFGGFDGLYLRMLASGTPTSVQLMWIPFTELDFHQQFLLIMRLSQDCLNDLWRSRALSYARRWLLEKIRNTTDDILMMIVVPTVEFIIPFPVRIRLGMAWPEYTDQVVGSSWYLQWRYKTEMNFNSRIKENTKWFQWSLKFLIRTFIYGYVVTYLFQLVRRKVPRLLGRGPLRRDPSLLKLKRLRTYLKLKTKIMKAKKKGRRDPISAAFDRMKRVKKPPIWLKDFSSIESMREEINEVVAFLQNPGAFQEMGARAPRGVLIVGERGSGKTSLALAIAAEAKVPVVKVTSQQLESGQGVGQGASNVRELFQTARDLAPVIIFVEDFDLFAGVRGNFIHTKQQDHEAFINQLLVELDGFEKQDGVVLMATTRNLKQIDEALRRPGRMDRVFHLQRPTQTEREKILRVAAKRTMDKEVIDFVDWGKVAEKTALLRPMELKCVPVALEGSAFRSKLLDTDELMGYVSWFATFRGRIPKWVRKSKFMKLISEMLVNHLGLTLTKEDLQKVVDLMEPYGHISNGIELLAPSAEWTTEMKFPHAVWAAGRGLIALLLPNFDVIDNLWLEPSSWEGIGYMKVTKPKSEGSVSGNVDSRSYLEKKLVFCFGSYVASQLLLPFGEEDFLSSADLRQAQGIATQMVIEYGWGPDDSPTIYRHGNAVKTLSMGNNYEYEIAAKVEKIYDLAYDKAKTMLQNNRRVLERIVEELVETEALSGKHLERILAAHGGIKEKEPFFLSNVHEEPVFSSILENGSVSGAALSSAGN